jgi:nitroimidazol reductase NimA-like FMN-containing flavoprotein (pyridoxamine 5'-phosphate oxidase superfamily)
LVGGDQGGSEGGRAADTGREVLMAVHAMQKPEREISDPAEIRRILDRGKYATIAMCRNREPYLVTLSCGFDEARRALYFHSALKGLKLDILRDNPRVCATVILDLGYRPGLCSHAYRSVVLRGRMSLVEDLDEKRHGLDVLLRQLEPEAEEVRRRQLPDEAAYRAVGILRLDIEDARGKANG